MRSFCPTPLLKPALLLAGVLLALPVPAAWVVPAGQLDTHSLAAGDRQFLGDITHAWVGFAEQIGRNWEIAFTDSDAPKYMRDNATTGVALDIATLAPILKAAISTRAGRTGTAGRSTTYADELSGGLPAGYRELPAAGAAANPVAGLPAGYRRVADANGHTAVIGPRGGVYHGTDYIDSAGNMLYMNNGKLYALEGGQRAYIPASQRVAGESVLVRGDVTRGTQQGPVIIGETMTRVEATAARTPGARILNDMPDFRAMGMTPDQVTSAMMQHNRKWILEQMRSGRQIIDIGADPNRAVPSIFYQMEQNMLRNYQRLHPEFNNVVRP